MNLRNVKRVIAGVICSVLLLSQGIISLADDQSNIALAQYYALLASQGGNDTVSADQALALAQYYSALAAKETVNNTTPSSMQSETQVAPQTVSMPKNIINKGASNEAYVAVVNAYLKLPASFRSLIEKNKVKIYVRRSNKASNAASNFIVNINENGQFDSTSPAFPIVLTKALYHELGHQYDFIQKKKSKRNINKIDPFPAEQKPLLENAANVRIDLGNNSYMILGSDVDHGSQEAIAVLSECYFYDPVNLYSVCPYGYAYADKYLGKYK